MVLKARALVVKAYVKSYSKILKNPPCVKIDLVILETLH